MIGKLKGVIDTIGEDFVIIDVSGVGYVVFCSANTLRQMPQIGEAATLTIETHVREDHIHLYGFISREEKKIFQQLTKVNGVGNRVALAILSSLTPEQVVTAICAKDKNTLTKAPGVGGKLAERIITELKDKIESAWSEADIADFGSASASPKDNSTADAISALTNLGYSRSDAYAAINRAANSNKKLSVDELIFEGLKELSGRK